MGYGKKALQQGRPTNWTNARKNVKRLVMKLHEERPGLVSLELPGPREANHIVINLAALDAPPAGTFVMRLADYNADCPDGSEPPSSASAGGLQAPSAGGACAPPGGGACAPSMGALAPPGGGRMRPPTILLGPNN
jgi:hypothetical protein